MAPKGNTSLTVKEKKKKSWGHHHQIPHGARLNSCPLYKTKDKQKNPVRRVPAPSHPGWTRHSPSASRSRQLCAAWVKNSLFRALPLRRISPSAPTCRDKPGHTRSVCSSRSTVKRQHSERETPSYLSVHFREEVEKLLLEVRRERVEGSGVNQGPQVRVDQDGTRRFEVDILTPVPLHLPCSLRAGK